VGTIEAALSHQSAHRQSALLRDFRILFGIGFG